MPSRRQSSEMFSSPRSPFQHDADLLFSRVLPACLTPNVLELALPALYPARIYV